MSTQSRFSLMGVSGEVLPVARPFLPALLAALALSVVAFTSPEDAGKETGANADSPAAGEPLSVGLLDFENEGGDPEIEPYRDGFRWLLARSLAEVRAIRLLPGAAIEFARGKTETALEEKIDDATTRRIGEWLEARRVIRGRYRRDGGQWTATLRQPPLVHGSSPTRPSQSMNSWR